MENRPENNKSESKPRTRRLPPFAAFVTLVIGGFFFIFSLLESIGGFMQKPIRWDFAVGGLMEILVFSLPFLVVTWLLWVRPKIGGILLIAIGISMAVWMWIGWNRPDEATEWIIRLIFTAVPILLGLFTLMRAKISRPRLANGNA
jgi:hypothetical protein